MCYLLPLYFPSLKKRENLFWTLIFQIGAVLSQRQEGEERTIAYFSRVLNKAKRIIV